VTRERKKERKKEKINKKINKRKESGNPSGLALIMSISRADGGAGAGDARP